MGRRSIVALLLACGCSRRPEQAIRLIPVMNAGNDAELAGIDDELLARMPRLQREPAGLELTVLLLRSGSSTEADVRLWTSATKKVTWSRRYELAESQRKRIVEALAERLRADLP